VPNSAFGRFSPRESEEIDREEAVEFEYFNDILSYRIPFWWQKEYARAPVGYLVNYGSLNQNRAYFYEDLHLISGAPGEIGLRLWRQRYETTLEQQQQQELRVSFPLGSSKLYLSLLGDGDTYKKWGDLGIALSYGHPLEALYVDLAYWRVDVLHRSKEEEGILAYTRSPITFAAVLKADYPRGYVQIAANFDSPLTLLNHREKSDYRYWRKTLESDIAARGAGGLWQWGIKTDFDEKGESKELAESPHFFKGLRRRSFGAGLYSSYDAGAHGLKHRHEISYGERRADYSYLAAASSFSLATASVPPEPSSASTRRR
jgi:hypothetical protein